MQHVNFLLYIETLIDKILQTDKGHDLKTWKKQIYQRGNRSFNVVYVLNRSHEQMQFLSQGNRQNILSECGCS